MVAQVAGLLFETAVTLIRLRDRMVRLERVVSFVSFQTSMRLKLYHFNIVFISY